MNKRILHLINSLDNGGCERMLLRTLPHLTGFEHYLLTLKQRGSLSARFEEEGLNVRQIENIFKLRSSVNNLSPDLVITYLFHADFVGRILVQPLSKIKVIPFLRTTYNFPRYWPARLFDQFTSPLVNHYFANSTAVRDYYISKLQVHKSKITVIPNGIDPNIYSRSKSLRSKYRRNFGFGQKDVVFIDVANLHPNKGHKHLLIAFDKLFNRHKNIGLLLVGDGEERQALNSQAEKLQSFPKIRFLGKRDDVPSLLNCSDIYVSPTYFEGMSNALMEAMAAGLPVITTAIPENKLLVKSGRDGLLVSVDNQLDLKLESAMKNLMNHSAERSRLGHNAEIKIKREYSMEATVKLWSKELSFYA
jgi:glycosyltransferase involved in cell wall biosynthesis